MLPPRAKCSWSFAAIGVLGRVSSGLPRASSGARERPSSSEQFFDGFSLARQDRNACDPSGRLGIFALPLNGAEFARTSEKRLE
jgi:hypothetical protein